MSEHEGDMSFLANAKGVRPQVLPTMGREISPVDDVRSLGHIVKVILRFNPHIIHTHTAKAGTLGRLAGISVNSVRGGKRKIKLVHTFHGHIFHDYFSPLKTSVFIQIERLLARFTDRIIVISPSQQHDICNRFRIAQPGKVRVIPLGFELSRFSYPPGRKEEIRAKYFPNDSGNASWVGIVGRLTSIKNHRMLLETARNLKEEGKGDFFRFLIVGGGELKEELSGYSAELGLEEMVAFTGWQEDMPSLYKALDIVALTSLNEGTPVTLIEAMAAGKPVVATDVGGVRDLMGVIDNTGTKGYKIARNGILVRPGESEALAKALLLLHRDKDLSRTMAAQAEKFVLNNYTTQKLVNNLDSLYTELVGIPPGVEGE